MTFYTLLTMIFLHIVDDFYLQRILADLKQKSWWFEHYPDKLYKHDWKIALFLHAFSWTFMISIPVVYHFGTDLPMVFYFEFFIMLWIHAVVDHMKANDRMIGLMQDQLIHIVQIILHWLICSTILGG